MLLELEFIDLVQLSLGFVHAHCEVYILNLLFYFIIIAFKLISGQQCLHIELLVSGQTVSDAAFECLGGCLEWIEVYACLRRLLDQMVEIEMREVVLLKDVQYLFLLLLQVSLFILTEFAFTPVIDQVLHSALVQLAEHVYVKVRFVK